MAQEIINYGNTANDGTGDPLRDAFIKVDDNFTQIWAAGPVGSNITIQNNTVSVINTNGNLILSPNGVGIIQTNRPLYPRLDNTYDVGSENLRYRSIFVGAGGITNDGNLTLGNIANLRIPGGTNGYVIQTDGAGNLSWVAMPGAGNGSPGGADTQVQFNNSGLFGGSNTFTFSNATSTLSVGNIVTGSANISSDGNSWIFSGDTMIAPSGATWQSNRDTLDEYIQSASNGYLNFQTFDVSSNVATELHMEHGLVHINIYNGVPQQWEFNANGNFDAPGNITTPGNISGNYFLGDGSQLTNLPGGVVQADAPPPSPNATTLWWDEITGRLYVWYTDVDGSQWVDAAPAQGGYGNSNVASYLAVGGVTTAISTTGNISGNYFIGNGSQLTGISASTGNVTFSNQAVVGTGDQQGASGLYLAPGTESVGNLQYLRVRGGDAPTHIHLDTGNNTYFDQYFGDDFKYVKLANTGNIVINSNDAVGNSAQWTFDNFGTLTLPGGSRLRPLGANLDIFAGTGSYVNLITSDESSSMGVNNSGGYITTAGGTWNFDTTGNLTAPGNVSAVGNVTGNYIFGNGSQLTNVTASVPSQTILPTIQTITVEARPAGLFGGGTGGANVTVANTIPVTEYGVIITDGTVSEKYKTGSLGSIPGTVSLTFTTGLNSAQFTVFAYVTSNAGTFYSNSATGTSGICLLAGTQIALSDGSHKAIEDITYHDKLLSWDFDRGCYVETTAVWIKRGETGSQYNLLTFSDGTKLRTFDQHRIFNKQAGAFTYPMTDATPIGTVTVNEHGQEITLTNKQVIVDTIEYYNVITHYHMNLFSDSVLTSCRFNNIYSITDMKFVKDGRTLRTRAEFKNIPDRFFHGLRLAEQTTDIETVEWYVNRLLRTEVSTKSEITV